MRKSIIIPAMTLLATLPALGVRDAYVQRLMSGSTMGVSPDGKYVIGYPSLVGNDVLSTFLFDTEERGTDWVTEYVEEAPDLGGRVAAISKSGNIMVGALRDCDWVAPVAQDGTTGESLIYDQKLFTACLWKNGELIKLDHNKYEDVNDFKSQDASNPYPKYTDGFTAEAISDDETIILGYITFLGSYYPVRWILNPESGKYESELIPRPEGERLYRFVGHSADCKTFIWNNNSDSGKSYIWRNGDLEYTEIFRIESSNEMLLDVQALALSPNGEWVTFECIRNMSQYAYGVYNLDTKELRWIPFPDNKSIHRWWAANIVTDDACGFMIDGAYELYYFDSQREVMLPVQQYLGAFPTSISGLSKVDVTKSVVHGISRDGKVIAGNFLVGGGVQDKGWVISLPEDEPVLSNITGLEAYFKTPTTLVVKWNPIHLDEGCSLRHYLVSIDGETVELAEPAIDADGRCRTEIATYLGTHDLEVGAVIAKGDNEVPAIAGTMNVNLSSDTSLYFFEDLDDSEFVDNMGYAYIHDTFNRVFTRDGSNVNYYLDVADFNNNTPFWCTGSISSLPWDTYLESRWFDATDEKDFYFTYHEKNFMVNSCERSSLNTFSVEYTVDGENWYPLHTSTAEENGGRWNIRVIEMTELEGKIFRLRFHAQGPGVIHTEWGVDYYGIRPSSEVFEAPQGLMATKVSENMVKLAWKNNLGAYEVSHNYNSPMTYNNNIGNAGAPLQVACDYDKYMLAGMEGKYITSVATLVYEPPTEEQTWHTTVEAIVYDEQLNELSRGRLGENGPWYDLNVDKLMPIQNIYLDKPVKVEAGKTYRVAIRISDYVEAMCPIWYFSASDDYVPGVTDLYSDADDGKTWNTIFDLYADDDEQFELYGKCIFNIRPCITDEAEPVKGEYNQQQWFYQVYRDGELMWPGILYFTQQSCNDYSPLPLADYTVQAYRRDGSRSAISSPLTVNSASVNNLAEDSEDLQLVMEKDFISLKDDYDKVTLYDLQGVAVAESRNGVISTKELGGRFYILVAEKGGRRSSRKIILSNI